MFSTNALLMLVLNKTKKTTIWFLKKIEEIFWGLIFKTALVRSLFNSRVQKGQIWVL